MRGRHTETTTIERKTEGQQKQIDQLLNKKAELTRYCSAPLNLASWTAIYFGMNWILNYCQEDAKEIMKSKHKNDFADAQRSFDLDSKYKLKENFQKSSENFKAKLSKLEIEENLILKSFGQPTDASKMTDSSKTFQRIFEITKEKQECDEKYSQSLKKLNQINKDIKAREEDLKTKLPFLSQNANQDITELDSMHNIVDQCYAFLPAGSLIPFAKQLSEKLYLGLFYRSYKHAHPMTKAEANSYIGYLEKQIQSLEKVAERNKYLARFLSIGLFAYTLYQLITSTDYSSFTDVVTLVPTACIGYGILEIALKDLQKDLDWSEETRIKNEITKATQVLKKMTIESQLEHSLYLLIKDEELNSTDELVADTSSKSNKCISLIFKGGNKTIAKRSAMVEQIKTLFKNDEIDCVDSGSNYLCFSPESLASLTEEKINFFKRNINILIGQTIATTKLTSQLQTLYEKYGYTIITKPEYENDLRVFRIFFAKTSENPRIKAMDNEILKKLFPAANIISDNENQIEFIVDKPAVEKVLNNLDRTLTLSKHTVSQEFQDEQHYSKSKPVNKTPRNITKGIESEQKKKGKDKDKSAKEELQQTNNLRVNTKRKVMRGKGIPSGRFFMQNDLTRKDFNDDDLFEYVSAKLSEDEVKISPARRGRASHGFLFIDPIRKTFDNGRRFEATGKYKLQGKYNNVRVYCSETREDDGTVTYHARGLKLKHVKDKHNKF